MDNTDDENNWLKNILIPFLIENGTLLKYHSINEKLIEKDKFKLNEIKLNYITSKEAFMLTKCYKSTIDFNYNGNNYILKLIVKKTPDVPEETFNAVNFDALFHNEITGYTIILPKFREFATKEIEKNEACLSMKNYPNYYYSKLEKNYACIVLGDFVADGWRMTTRLINLSIDHVILSVKLLGNLHGISYALKNKKPEEFKKMKELLKEARFDNEVSAEWNLMMNYGGRRAIKSAKQYYPDKISNEFYKKIEKVFDNFFQYAKKRCQPIEPFANICHGDYLRNNIAFKYQGYTEIPVDVMMFDLQTLRYSSPMIDLSVFLFLSVGKDVRNENFSKIFNCYREELVKIYKEQTNSDEIPEFLSQKSMLAEYTRYLAYAIGIAGCFLFCLHAPKDIMAEEFLNNEKTEEETINEVMTEGGEIVDKELASMVWEYYDLSVKENTDGFI